MARYAVFVRRGVLGGRVSRIFETEAAARNHLAQFGPSDGYVAKIKRRRR